MGSTNQIPIRLINTPQWVCFLSHWKKDGKLAKVPINPRTGLFASVNDFSTWGTFQQACQCLENRPGLSGLGFVFSEADPFIGVDFDHCRDPLNGCIHPQVMQWIETLDSYTEISFSGSGLHVFIVASLPSGGRKKDSIELYERQRFFVVTGNHLDNTPDEINVRQTEINQLQMALFGPPKISLPGVQPPQCRDIDDDALLKQILASRQGEKFLRLFDGITAGYDSHSQADLALCSILSCWTKDEAQIDRIFRNSGLYREKWDALRSKTTYGSLTIQRALGRR
jgi:primase-polymerase (primpol)-like protein